MKRNPLRILWLLLGLLCLALGTVGGSAAILPSVPFYLATVFCFAKSSESFTAGSWAQPFIKRIWRALWRGGR